MEQRQGADDVVAGLKEQALAAARQGDTGTLPGFDPRRIGRVDPWGGTNGGDGKASVFNADGKLLPGMFGQATLSLQAPATVSVLPSRAVRFDGKGAAKVFVILDDNTVAVKEIQILADDGQNLQVAGIEPGQRVIDAHLQRFTDGQLVRVLNP